MADELDPQAFSRKTRTPINLWGVPTSEVSAHYFPSRLLGLGTDRIELEYPKGQMAPRDVMDVVKHELVHQALKGIPLPKDYEKTGFEDVPKSGFRVFMDKYLKELEPFDMQYGTPATPHTMYNWPMWRREGDPSREIPAYMSIYNPKDMGTGYGQVTPEQRNQYMSQFMSYLRQLGHAKAAGTIQDLIESRKSYYPTGLFK